MIATEAAKLCRFAKAACPQQAIDDDTPAAWFVILSDLRFEDAQEALVNVVRKQPFVSPAEIRTEVKRLRAARVTAFGPIPDPPDEVGAKGYRVWRAEVQRKIADGEVTRPDQLGIETRPGRPMPALEGVFRRPADVEPVEGEDDEDQAEAV